MIDIQSFKATEDVSTFCQNHDVVMMVCEDGHVIGIKPFDALTIAAMLLASASLYLCDEIDDKRKVERGRVN